MEKRKIKHLIKKTFHMISIFSIYNYRKYKLKAIDNYKNGEITILSPNCIGGEIYNILNLKFMSPFINTSIDRIDFLTILENLDDYLEAEIKYKKRKKDNTPILSINPSKLPEIEIAFPHDYDYKKCINDWNKRKSRIIKEKIYIICDDHNYKEADYERFNNLKYRNKLLFTENEKMSLENKEYYYIEDKKMLETYQYKGIDGIYKFQHFFDFCAFLNK